MTGPVCRSRPRPYPKGQHRSFLRTGRSTTDELRRRLGRVCLPASQPHPGDRCQQQTGDAEDRAGGPGRLHRRPQRCRGRLGSWFRRGHGLLGHGLRRRGGRDDRREQLRGLRNGKLLFGYETRLDVRLGRSSVADHDARRDDRRRGRGGSDPSTPRSHGLLGRADWDLGRSERGSGDDSARGRRWRSLDDVGDVPWALAAEVATFVAVTRIATARAAIGSGNRVGSGARVMPGA